MTAANEALSTDKPAAVTFDTLAAAQNLRTSGLEERQAEAIVATISKAMSETVTTKADLELQSAAIRADIEALRVATKTDIEKSQVATKADIEILRVETKAEIGAQRSELKADTDALSSEMKTDMELFKLSVESSFEALEQSMASLQDKIVIRIGAMMVTMTFLLLAFGPFYFRWVMSLTASQ